MLYFYYKITNIIFYKHQKIYTIVRSNAIHENEQLTNRNINTCIWNYLSNATTPVRIRNYYNIIWVVGEREKEREKRKRSVKSYFQNVMGPSIYTFGKVFDRGPLFGVLPKQKRNTWNIYVTSNTIFLFFFCVMVSG